MAALALGAVPLCAQIVLSPLKVVQSPPAHSYMIGLIAIPDGPPYGPRVSMLTTMEAWDSNVAPAPTTFSMVFDSTRAGVRMYEDSLATYLPGRDAYLFTGGLFDHRYYLYSRNTGIVISSGVMSDLPALPNGVVARDTTVTKGGDPGATTDFFASSGALGSLFRYNAENGDQSGTAFGHSGAGQVSSGVGALAMGPDGRLNVLDTGRQEILRFDPDTLDYLGAFPLANTTTDNTAFTISSTGYIFTANQITANGDDLTGTIYDYATGDYVGTFEAPSIWGPGSNGGKLTMTADANGYVYIVNDTASFYVNIFDTNTLAAVPEPATCAALFGVLALGLALHCNRRR